jgi:hypothetical protein
MSEKNRVKVKTTGVNQDEEQVITGSAIVSPPKAFKAK